LLISATQSAVQRVDNATHQINHYPTDRTWQNKVHYQMDRNLSDGQCYPSFEQLDQKNKNPVKDG